MAAFSLTLATNATGPKNEHDHAPIYGPQATIYSKAQLKKKRIRSAELGYIIILENDEVTFKFQNQNLTSTIKEAAAHIKRHQYTAAIELLELYEGEESNYDFVADQLKLVVKERLKKKK